MYEIPSDYTGWVLIEFERPDAAPLPTRNGKLVFQIGKNGRMATSSKPQFGWAHDEYFYVGAARVELKRSDWGRGGQIWGGSNGSVQKAGQSQTYQTFFVGSEDAFKSASGAEPQP